MPDGGEQVAGAGLRRCRPALGTFVEITLLDVERADAHALRSIDAAFAAIERVAKAMSFHDPASDLSRLNASAHEAALVVDPWTRDVLLRAHDLFVHTRGLFDCAIADPLVVAGLMPRHAGVLVHEPRTDRATFADVIVDDDGRVRFRRPLALDLGGIAKGFAVDRAVDALAAHGVRSAVVNAGGDLRVLGQRPVPIHVRHHGRPIHVGSLADGALATSSTASERSTKAPGALVDPRSGALVEHAATWSVIAPDCATADALTKVLALAGDLHAKCRERYRAVPLVHDTQSGPAVTSGP